MSDIRPDLGALPRGRRMVPKARTGIVEDGNSEERIALMSPFAQERYRLHQLGLIDVNAELAAIPVDQEKGRISSRSQKAAFRARMGLEDPLEVNKPADEAAGVSSSGFAPDSQSDYSAAPADSEEI